MDAIFSQIMTVAPSFLMGLVIIVAGWFGSRWICQIFLKMAELQKWDEAISLYVKNTMRVIMVVVVTATGLQTMHVPISSILTTMGISGLIIGLGLRAELSNYFAGVVMLFSRPFKAGDLIEFGPPMQMGYVREVRMMFTRLDTLDHVQIVLPNSLLWRCRIFNFSKHQHRAVRIPMSFSYEVAKPWVEAIVLETLREHEMVLHHPQPVFSVTDVTAEKVHASAVAWTKVDQLHVFGTIVTKLREEFKTAGLELQLPSKDVDLRREE